MTDCGYWCVSCLNPLPVVVSWSQNHQMLRWMLCFPSMLLSVHQYCYDIGLICNAGCNHITAVEAMQLATTILLCPLPRRLDLCMLIHCFVTSVGGTAFL